MLKSLTSFLIFMSATAFAQSEKFGPAGEFDYYVFEMSYEKDFCATHRGNAECASMSQDRPMALHGLWPDRNDDPDHQYSFCGYNQDPISGLPWCSASIDVKGQMSSSVFNALATVMPGARQSCLYNHEWYEHGSCSGLSVEDYFAAESKVAASFDGFENLNNLLISSAGGTLARADILNALASDMGQAALSSVMLNCRRDRNSGAIYFSAIDVALDREQVTSFPRAGSFASFKSSKTGTCPASGITISR